MTKLNTAFEDTSYGLDEMFESAYEDEEETE